LEPVEWLYAIGSVILVSVISLVGVVTLSVSETKLKRVVFILVGLATGALFGDALIHLLPQAFESLRSKVETSLYVLAGIFVFFILEKFLRWRHEHVLQDAEPVHHIGLMNLVADGLHNLIDGMLIGASYLVDIKIGVATTLAVVLHELPQEIGDFGILLHAGFSRTRALVFNFLSASLAVIGAVVALVVGTAAASFSTLMLPITAGGFIYIAGSDLVPELHKESDATKSLLQFLALSAGVGLMLLLLLLE
jgi:zinc and cadmium transporter